MVRVTSRTESARRFVLESEESEIGELDAKREGSTFGARWHEANFGGRSRRRPFEMGAKLISVLFIEDCVSPPYVETFNSKLIKRFRTKTRSGYEFLNSEIPMFFICSIVINIRCPFQPFRTWPFSCIWLCNIWLFGARARHIRIMGIVRLGYHGSTETNREAAENN